MKLKSSVKQFFKELDYESIFYKTISNAREMFKRTAFIILFVMIAYPNDYSKTNLVYSIVLILYILDVSVELFLYLIGYKKSLSRKHPIFEKIASYIIYAALIPIEITLLNGLLDIPDNPLIVIRVFLIWFGVVSILGAIQRLAVDFAPKEHTVFLKYTSLDAGKVFSFSAPGVAKRVDLDNQENNIK